MLLSDIDVPLPVACNYGAIGEAWEKHNVHSAAKPPRPGMGISEEDDSIYL